MSNNSKVTRDDKPFRIKMTDVSGALEELEAEFRAKGALENGEIEALLLAGQLLLKAVDSTLLQCASGANPDPDVAAFLDGYKPCTPETENLVPIKDIQARLVAYREAWEVNRISPEDFEGLLELAERYERAFTKAFNWGISSGLKEARRKYYATIQDLRGMLRNWEKTSPGLLLRRCSEYLFSLDEEFHDWDRAALLKDIRQWTLSDPVSTHDVDTASGVLFNALDLILAEGRALGTYEPGVPNPQRYALFSKPFPSQEDANEKFTLFMEFAAIMRDRLQLPDVTIVISANIEGTGTGITYAHFGDERTAPQQAAYVIGRERERTLTHFDDLVARQIETAGDAEKANPLPPELRSEAVSGTVE